MSAPTSFDQQVADLIKHFTEAAADGLTWQETIALGKDFTAAAMEYAELEKLPGASKKAIVLTAARRLLDAVLPALEIPGLPWYVALVLPWLRPLLLQALMAIAEAWLEKTYAESYAPAKA